ncbi:perforin-1-like [Alosa sapidissima]|uniref:perforin-1-like n=1 Tax=Alosa sapidissima TaxID=34773 RepID=UPI001C09DCA5|nr:perforin-1-like [Alosa sapidissima]
MTTTPGHCLHHHHHHLLFLLLLLLLLHPSLGCQPSFSRTECDSLPFVPGHNLVGEGFDVVTMRSTGASVINTQTYMVGTGEHGNCTVCRNLLVGRRQKLPVAVANWRVSVRCHRALSAQMLMTGQAVLKENARAPSASWKSGLNLQGLNGFAARGTRSKSSSFAKSLSARDQYSYSRHDFTCRYYAFRLQARPPVTKAFQQAVRSLPVKYNSTTLPAYWHFISIYGTHFLRQVELGGRVQSTTAVRTCRLAMNGLSVNDVSICLSVEATATIRGHTASAVSSFCKTKGKKLKRGRSFADSFSQRVTDVLGGSGQGGDLLFAPGNKSSYEAWLQSLRTHPGAVAHSLTPLHVLLDRTDAEKRESLRRAVSEYVRGYAVPVACQSRCAVGRRTESCQCKCRGHRGIDANCCPTQPSLASLSVVVEKATGLWGDYFSKTDAYVKVFYGKRGGSTTVIWNNDFPRWNHRFTFGTIDLGRKVPLRFELWNDDLLGRASVVPTKGRRVSRRFPVKRGALYVSISAICAPSLTGPFCGRYSPTPPANGGLCYQHEQASGGHAWGQTPQKHA